MTSAKSKEKKEAFRYQGYFTFKSHSRSTPTFILNTFGDQYTLIYPEESTQNVHVHVLQSAKSKLMYM